MKAYYMIDFNVVACMFEIKINDIPILHYEVDGQVSSMVPINYAISKSGEQEISLNVLPLLGESELRSDAKVKYTIMKMDVTNEFEFVSKSNEYTTPKIKKDKLLPLIKHMDVFLAEITYSLHNWSYSEDLSKIKNIRVKLIEKYNEIRNAIDKKQFNYLNELLEVREDNMAKSMYLDRNERSLRIESLILAVKEGFKIMPIIKDSVLVLYGYNRLVMLKKINGESALYLYNAELEEEMMLDFTFHIPEGKTEFEII